MYTIYLVGDISEESYLSFSKKIAFVLKKHKKGSLPNININLTSTGGDAYTALAFHDLLANLKGKARITIHARGLVASAAVLILASGQVRVMSKNAWIMVHDDLVDLSDSRVAAARKDLNHYIRMENQWNSLMSNLTKADIKTWDKLHSDETFLTPTECFHLGLIDRVAD